MDDILNQALTKGVEMHISGEFELASELYGSVIKLQPNHADANHNMGLLKVDTGNDLDALPYLQTALEADTSISQFWLSYIKALVKLERVEEAIRILNLAKESGVKAEEFIELQQQLNVPSKTDIMINPNEDSPNKSKPNILDNLKLDRALKLAKQNFKEGSSEEAKQIYQDILARFPKNKKAIDGVKALSVGPTGKETKLQDPPQDHLQPLIDLYSQGQLQRALSQTKKLLKQFPNSVILYNICGASYAGLGKLDVSIEAYKKALAIKPDYVDACYNMGITLQDQGKLEEAIEAFKKALAIKPDYAEACYNMGVVLQEQGKLEEAIEAFNKALAIKPDYAEAYNNKGNALQTQGKLEEAIEAYDKALSIKPDYADAYNNMGSTLQDQGKLEEATNSYYKTLALKPDHAEAYNNMGSALKLEGKLEEAMEAYNKAISLKPDQAEVWNNMGNALQQQGKLEAAIEAFKKALAIKPDFQEARAQKLHQQAHICDWDSIENDKNLIPHLGTNQQQASPFSLLSLEDAPERHQLRSQIYAKEMYPQLAIPLPAIPSQQTKRLRVGYFSSDFKKHPVTFLITKMLSLHDREGFEIFAYSFGGRASDPWRQKVIDAVDVFKDVKEMSDREIALLARQDKIDIAIDLNGYTLNNRAGIFALRAAPIQMSYLGIAMTMGADFIDYLMADRISIPTEIASYYSENIMYLPNCYLVNDNSTVISNLSMSRSEMGLPEQGFVFCCFNQTYKITPNVFDIWMRVLRQVDGSVLWLAKSNEWSEQNLRKEAKNRGISGDRLIFADILPIDEHLARHKLADLFIDTFNFNAVATGSAALWAGLPLVTKLGKGFVTRVSGSMLSAIGLDELITKTERDYEELILDLATNPDRLFAVKQKLRSNRLSTPLFDTELFTKNIEKGYILAYENYLNGMEPKPLFINGE